jgi:hypothetical protein
MPSHGGGGGGTAGGASLRVVVRIKPLVQRPAAASLCAPPVSGGATRSLEFDAILEDTVGPSSRYSVKLHFTPLPFRAFSK